jgi:hypothetical protein
VGTEASFSSSGVGGNCACMSSGSSGWTLAGSVMLVCLSTLAFLGAEMGSPGAPFLPRGPLPSSARLLNFFRPWSANALRFTAGGAAASSFFPSWDSKESLRASSFSAFDNLFPISSCLKLARRSDLAGGGGGGSSFSFTDPEGIDPERTGNAGVGGTVAVEPLLMMRARDGGFASRDKLRDTILFLRRGGEFSGELIGDRGASWSSVVR